MHEQEYAYQKAFHRLIDCRALGCFKGRPRLRQDPRA